MKREGRQHGLVATCSLSTWNSDGSSSRRMVTQHQATAGTFIRVSQKPTNHSKYTSRCPRPRCPCCHTLPAGKAKDKTKGTHKLRSSDVVTNYRLVTWRVVDDDDARTGFKLSGFSASGILDHLDDHYEEEEEDHQIYDDEYEYDGSTHHQHPPEIELIIEHPNPNPNPNPNLLIEENIDDSASPSGGGDGDDDEISYCNVGIVWEQVDAGDEDDEEEGGWCLVQEL